MGETVLRGTDRLAVGGSLQPQLYSSLTALAAFAERPSSGMPALGAAPAPQAT